MSAVVDLLKTVWGFDSFRPLQEEAMKCVLEGRDSLTVLPTGSGKSLCFQAPAILMNGCAVIVSPLIALMKDQVDALHEYGVEAACIHTGLTVHEKRGVDERMQAGKLKLLYVAPERMMTPRFIAYLKRFPIAFIAIDEAHCISQWGHDFRPSYRELGKLKERFPELAIHAYTATATHQVRDDICTQLGFEGAAVHVGDFDRPNLVYRVQRRDDAFAQTKEIVDRHENESGIVYCISRKKVESLCAELLEAGYAAVPYHAGLGDEVRRVNQEGFLSEEAKIIVATVAFGMGIDKSNVRYVVHAAAPKSLEHYQQESGRAGRDGLEAECVLLHSAQDFNTWRMMLRDIPGEGGKIALDKLQDIAHYISTSRCRHAELVEYFGQPFAKKNCGACDTCLGEVDLHPEGESTARHILEAVSRIGDYAGAQYTTLVLAGSNEQRVLDKRHDALPIWGALSHFSPKDIRSWIEQMVQQRFLRKTGEYHILEITQEGAQAKDGQLAPRLLAPKPRRVRPRREKIATKSWEGVDKELFEKLRELRMEIANQQSVPAYIIFGDAPLRDMARHCPRTLDAFLDVSGVGEKKREAYGERFVACICEHMERLEEVASTEVPSERLKKAAGKPTRTKELAYRLFEEGRSVQQVASKIARTPAYAHKFLVNYLIQHGVTNPSPWLRDDAFHRVGEALEILGQPKESAIHDYLDGDLTVEEIKVAVVCHRNKEFE